MRVVSNELRQVFRAYTKQLRGEYSEAKRGEQHRHSRAKGYEKVDISEEAKALAAAKQMSSNGESREVEEREREEKKTKEKNKDRTDSNALSDGEEAPDGTKATDQEKQEQQ